MKIQMIVTVIIPVVIALAIQSYMILKLTDQVSLLTANINLHGSQQLEGPNFPILTPEKRGCESDIFEGQRESL
jgi:hypothetical protein